MKPESYETNLDKVIVLDHSPKRKIDWVNTLFLTLTPLLTLIAVPLFFYSYEGAKLPFVLWAIAFYFITGLSVTAGYHRLFAHRTYKAHWSVKLILLLFGAGTFQNSALKWSSDHRVHHTHVDDDHKDPYSIGKGFWWAHIGWVLFKEDSAKAAKFPKDLLNDKVVMFQHNYFMPIAIFMGFGIPTLVGYYLGSALWGFLLLGMARIVFVHHCTFFINSLCHMVGTRPYTDTNTARDSGIMALFSYGEGYHNYHHYFPTDYRNGIKWFHYDPTKWLIKSLSLVGLTSDLKKVNQKIIDKAVDDMKAKYSA